jgi:hypothetical protein
MLWLSPYTVILLLFDFCHIQAYKRTSLFWWSLACVHLILPRLHMAFYISLKINTLSFQ